jgi:hypothetical protein
LFNAIIDILTTDLNRNKKNLLDMFGTKSHDDASRRLEERPAVARLLGELTPLQIDYVDFIGK